MTTYKALNSRNYMGFILQEGGRGLVTIGDCAAIPLIEEHATSSNSYNNRL